MKNTKWRIKEQARILFNDKGVADTTLRKIAKAMGISQGNLNYHFKTKQDLLEAIYFDLVLEMDEKVKSIEPGKTLFLSVYATSQVSMGALYNYRFLLRDFYKIMRESEKIRSHYFKLQAQRTKQFEMIFQGFVSQGWMRPPEFRDEYKRLYERMNILGDNWINAQELFMGEIGSPVDYFAQLLFESIYPYLTSTGKAEFGKLPHLQKGALE